MARSDSTSTTSWELALRPDLFWCECYTTNVDNTEFTYGLAFVSVSWIDLLRTLSFNLTHLTLSHFKMYLCRPLSGNWPTHIVFFAALIRVNALLNWHLSKYIPCTSNFNRRPIIRLIVWGPTPIRLGFIGAPIATAISFNLISIMSVCYGTFLVPKTAWHPLSIRMFEGLGVLVHLGLSGIGKLFFQPIKCVTRFKSL